MTELVDKMLGGSAQSLARLISLVEREAPESVDIMRLVYPRIGGAHIIGITGPPGAGKSTTVDRLTAELRHQGLTVGIIAVDPTSPFSGGAVLGDRIRMQQHYTDEGVFIRSMATRGSQGGLPKTTRGVVKLLDAFKKDIILIETVGVGQTELDIMEAADTVVVVLVPESGDTIQTMKAGLLEIADLFVVNKADRPGADSLMTELEIMLSNNPKRAYWRVPVLAAQAVNNVGIKELCDHVQKHREMLLATGRLNTRREEQRKKEFVETMERKITSRLWKLVAEDPNFAQCVARVEQGHIDPYSACSEILSDHALAGAWLRKLGDGG